MKIYQMARDGRVFIGLSLLVLALGYNNCSKVQVSSAEDAQKVVEAGGDPEITPDPVVPDVPPKTPDNPNTPSDLITTCANAKALGKLRTKPFTSKFEDAKAQCEWGKNGNLAMLQGFVQARREQSQTFDLSDGSSNVKICNIRMKSAKVTNFYYDDNVIMTLNGYILASTTDFTKHFQAKNGYYLYSWDQLIGKVAQNEKDDTVAARQYCAGKSQNLSSCSFPLTETEGTAQVDIGEKVIQTILGMTVANKFTLGVVTTGDNDPATDCRHVPIDLNVDIDYFVE